MKEVDAANIHFSNMAQVFDHPCKQTCSGWEQGRERGIAEGRRLERERIVKLLLYSKYELADWFANFIENEGEE